MKAQTIRVATRKSPLALRQTELAVEALRTRAPHWQFEIIPTRTTGDERMSWSLQKAGGKGLFTSALEQALLAGKADLAVHSAKDLPTEVPEGLVVAGYLPRAPAGDMFIIREELRIPSLVATGSPRRRAQLKVLFPKAAWKEIRGNVHSRLEKIAEGHADATVMAIAGLHRLGIDRFPGLRFVPIPIEVSVPAAGQGAIGLQVREADAGLYADILCRETAFSVNMERAFLAAMGGGCHSATAAHHRNGRLHVFDESTGYQVHPVPAERDLHDADEVKNWVQTRIP